jgi:cullin 3
MSRHSGRRLTWLKNMGTADVQTQLSAHSKRKELSMSTYCMVVLVTCFNGAANDAVSFKEIKAATGIPGDEAKRAIQSLAMGKYRILTNTTRGGSRDILDEDLFQVNLDFTHPLSKIKIPTISASSSGSGSSVSEDAKERAATLEKIATDRRYQIEASVVRVMKSRKTMQHNLLVAQVVEQLSVRFNPDIMMVKKRIEELIERDYLERDEGDR